MEDNIVVWVLFGVISWSAVFILVRSVLPKRSFDFCNRLVSTVHVFLAVILSCLSVQDWRCPLCPLVSPPTTSQKRAMAVTLSYLIYDFICCLFDTQISIDNLIHHIVSIIGLGAALVYRMCGLVMVTTLCLTEMSSPFLHLREILKELGYRDTNLNFSADLSFAVIFTFGRIVLGPFVPYVTLTTDNPLLIKAMSLSLQMVCVFWFYKIARMVRYKVAKRKTSTKMA
ncbi:hypothetical protein AMTRI_Chr03g48800 [Amborella trichopoda]